MHARPPSDAGDEPPDLPAPFSPAWLRALEPLVVGTSVRAAREGRDAVAFVCHDGERRRPWTVQVVDGYVAGITSEPTAPEVARIAHSVTVGWRLLGLSIRGFHRVDELVVEHRAAKGTVRHPIPPADGDVIDLGVAPPSAPRWRERVIDSPIGTLFVRRVLVDGGVVIADVSTRPPAITDPDDVETDIAWRDVMALRRGDRSVDPVARRAWRGSADDVAMVREAVVRERQAPCEACQQRDRALLRALRTVRAMRTVLRHDPRWRPLWLPSARPR